MYHLLTAVTDPGAFPMRRRLSPARSGPVAPSAATVTAVVHVAGAISRDPSPLLRIADGAIPATSFPRPILCCRVIAVALALAVVSAADATAQSGTMPSSRADKIANALTAAPEEITRNATVRDWPSKEGDGFTLLREGTNGWVCLPDDTVTPGNDPMCMDATFYAALSAYVAGKTPKVTRVAYAYMLTSDAEGSNLDPRAGAPTPTNQWHHAGPHVMVLFPDAKLLDGVPTSPSAYGPYVMFPGTPIAHVMLPTASGYAGRPR